MASCSRCNAEIPEPDMGAALDREQNFRENFPNTWDDTEGRVLVCNNCFDEMDSDTDDYERSQL